MNPLAQDPSLCMNLVWAILQANPDLTLDDATMYFIWERYYHFDRCSKTAYIYYRLTKILHGTMLQSHAD